MKMFGCPHMRCLCGAQWCWDCRRPIKACHRRPCAARVAEGEDDYPDSSSEDEDHGATDSGDAARADANDTEHEQEHGVRSSDGQPAATVADDARPIPRGRSGRVSSSLAQAGSIPSEPRSGSHRVPTLTLPNPNALAIAASPEAQPRTDPRLPPSISPDQSSTDSSEALLSDDEASSPWRIGRLPTTHTARTRAQQAFQSQVQRWVDPGLALQQQSTRHQALQQAQPASQEDSGAVQWPQQQHEIVARLQAAQEQQATQRHNEALRRTQQEMERLRRDLRQQQAVQQQDQAVDVRPLVQNRLVAWQDLQSPSSQQRAPRNASFIEPDPGREDAVSQIRPEPALEHGQTGGPTDDDANLDDPDGDIEWERSGYDFGSEPEERSYDGWGCHHRFTPLTIDSMHEKWFKILPWENIRRDGLRMDCTGCWTEMHIQTKEQTASEAAWECPQCGAVHCEQCVKTAKARIRKWKDTESPEGSVW
jgi:hypothetical protein